MVAISFVLIIGFVISFCIHVFKTYTCVRRDQSRSGARINEHAITDGGGIIPDTVGIGSNALPNESYHTCPI
ncbi:hypothetical protein GCK32_006370 [Trichostrongylus colubriformis]|uniref:Uncharacterized protein n=1 Tax=Trichostrongylus colubriformis TaxID=6319 RepID=A0AAN8EQN0_TRICO